MIMIYLPLISATVIMLVMSHSPQEPAANNFGWLCGASVRPPRTRFSF